MLWKRPNLNSTYAGLCTDPTKYIDYGLRVDYVKARRKGIMFLIVREMYLYENNCIKKGKGIFSLT